MSATSAVVVLASTILLWKAHWLLGLWALIAWGLAFAVNWRTSVLDQRRQVRQTRLSLNEHYMKSGLPIDRWAKPRGN